MSTLSPDLPPELIENILEHVYGQYKSPLTPLTLHQCALVCQLWRSIAQSLLFSEIVLRKPEDIQHILSRSIERLHPYVRRVWVAEPPISGEEELLDLLPNLQELYLLGGPEYYYPELSESFIDSGSILGRLTCLSFSIITIPFDLFRHCLALQELRLDSCWADTDFDSDIEPDHLLRTVPDHPQTLIELRSFHFRAEKDMHMGVLSWMLSPRCVFDFSKLTTLRTSERTDELESYELIRALVEKCTSTLEDLMVDPPTSHAVATTDLTPGVLLNPPKLSNLRTVIISIFQDEETNFVPWLTAFFSSLPAGNNVEKVFVLCMIDHIIDESTPERSIAQYGWEMLDNILSSSMQALKQVVITLNKDSGNINVLETSFRKAFPGLTKRGMLEIVTQEPDFVFRDPCWLSV